MLFHPCLMVMKLSLRAQLECGQSTQFGRRDPNFEKAVAGGVTTAQILPGSANLFGGRGVTVKLVPTITMMGMKFPDAPHALKMACGANPKRVYGDQGGPQTRMGNMAGYRTKWIAATAYKKSWEDYEKAQKRGDNSIVAPVRDLEMDTLMGVLNGEIRIHNHCYRADEMANMIELSKEFDYEIAAFHHAVEAYKVADILAENNVCAVVWADWWGFKQEAHDMLRENAALVDMAGACAIIHSDDEIQIQRLNQEVAKVISASNKMGYPLTPAKAITWITSKPAKSLGLEDQIGSIEVGKTPTSFFGMVTHLVFTLRRVKFGLMVRLGTTMIINRYGGLVILI